MFVGVTPLLHTPVIEGGPKLKTLKTDSIRMP
jgi:hypothetical protein